MMFNCVDIYVQIRWVDLCFIWVFALRRLLFCLFGLDCLLLLLFGLFVWIDLRFLVVCLVLILIQFVCVNWLLLTSCIVFALFWLFGICDVYLFVFVV